MPTERLFGFAERKSSGKKEVANEAGESDSRWQKRMRACFGKRGF